MKNTNKDDREWSWREELRNQILARRERIIARMEKERGSKVVTMVHRKEPWVKGEGYPEIEIEDSEKVLLNIKRAGKKQPVELILHTPGGIALAAQMIAIALKMHKGKVTVHVPFYAMSGGTMIALAADEIRMERFSVMGPLDPQIDGLPSNSLVSILERKPIQAIDDKTIVLADIARLSISEVQNFVRWLLKRRMKAKEAKSLAEYLTGGYISHDEPISHDVIKGFGLPVELGVPEIVYEFFDTCTHGACLRPGHGEHRRF
ncbi:MAG: ATP-dependent Clp protease proteolytic subunit [Thermoplasmata archaeon]